MKIAILSRNKHLYSTRRLVQAGEDAGHEMHVIDTLRCYMSMVSHKPEIHFKGQVLEGFDAVIPRIGASVTQYGTAVLRQFEMMGVFPVNESVAISRSRDKLRSLQLLSRKGVGLPVTGFAHSPDDIPDLINMVGGAPLVIKMLEGTQGIGVVLAETRMPSSVPRSTGTGWRTDPGSGSRYDALSGCSPTECGWKRNGYGRSTPALPGLRSRAPDACRSWWNRW